MFLITAIKNMFCSYLFEDMHCLHIFLFVVGLKISTQVCKHIHELLKRAPGMSKILVGTSVLELRGQGSTGSKDKASLKKFEFLRQFSKALRKFDHVLL